MKTRQIAITQSRWMSPSTSETPWVLPPGNCPTPKSTPSLPLSPDYIASSLEPLGQTPTVCLSATSMCGLWFGVTVTDSQAFDRFCASEHACALGPVG